MPTEPVQDSSFKERFYSYGRQLGWLGIDVLSEIPGKWQRHLNAWAKWNAS